MASQPWIRRTAHHAVDHGVLASMEPWPPSHGYPFQTLHDVGKVKASMEPWPPSHGYCAGGRRYGDRPTRFNGAMASQPWIRGFRVPLYVVVGLASMEPWPPSHGYSVNDAAPDRGPIASMEPWPPSHGYMAFSFGAERILLASMEPWPPSHGYTHQRGTMSCICRRFNGAMASQPWIPGR